MNLRGAAALLALLLLGACATGPGPGSPSSPTETAATPAADVASGTATTTAVAIDAAIDAAIDVSPDRAADGPPLPAAVRVEIDAPAPLKALLVRHLDLVRLGALMRGDTVDATEWSRLIAATPAQVHALLETEGFFEAQVAVERGAVSAEGVPASVRVTVDPGPRTVITQLTLEVEGELQTGADADDRHATETLADLRSSWPMPVGAPFINNRWADAKVATLARLRAAGFAAATWSGTAAAIDAEKHTARLFLVVDSGPLFRFGDMRVEGLAAHDAQTVRNLGAFAPGAPLTESAMLEFQERLQKVGLFDGVTVTLVADVATAHTAEVTVRVREAPLQVYTFGIGYEVNNGARVTVEHVYRRVFGMAVTANNKVEVGQLRQAWNGELSTHPNERLYRNLIGGAVERLEGTDDVVMSQRVRIGRAKDMQRINRLTFLEVERSSRTTETREDETVALSANYHAIWRRLDSLLLPTEGYSLSLQGGSGFSRGTDSANGWFSRAYGRLTGYLPLGHNWFGQARIEAGQVFVRSGVLIPDSQLFRAGGEDSVRGYSYRSLGPVVDGAVSSGNVLLTSSIELARPISEALPSVWGAVFVDAGNAAANFNNFKAAFGTGVGVRWRSPVGPLRLDAAWANELKAVRLHFSVGVSF